MLDDQDRRRDVALQLQAAACRSHRREVTPPHPPTRRCRSSPRRNSTEVPGTPRAVWFRTALSHRSSTASSRLKHSIVTLRPGEVVGSNERLTAAGVVGSSREPARVGHLLQLVLALAHDEHCTAAGFVSRRTASLKRLASRAGSITLSVGVVFGGTSATVEPVGSSQLGPPSTFSGSPGVTP